MHRCVEGPGWALFTVQYRLCSCVCAVCGSVYGLPCRLQTNRNKGERKRGAERSKSEWTFFLCSDYKAHTFFFFFLFAVSCLHAHLRVFPACSFNFRALVKIHKPHTRAQSSTGKKRHYDEGASLLHTKVAHNHYTLQVRVCLYWGFTPTDEQANAMTQQAECTRGTICLHQLQRTNYPDYRAVWVYMSVCLCVWVCICECVFACVPVCLRFVS